MCEPHTWGKTEAKDDEQQVGRSLRGAWPRWPRDRSGSPWAVHTRTPELWAEDGTGLTGQQSATGLEHPHGALGRPQLCPRLCQSCIDWNREVLKRELGLADRDIIDIPQLFKPEKKKAVAFFPDLVRLRLGLGAWGKTLGPLGCRGGGGIRACVAPSRRASLWLTTRARPGSRLPGKRTT